MSKLEIHHINVGAGDSTLIIVRKDDALQKKLAHLPNVSGNRYEWLQQAVEAGVPLGGTVEKSVLIDAGNGAKQAAKVEKYMQRMGVVRPDWFLASHYHQDHVGGATSLIDGAWQCYDRGAPHAAHNKAAAKAYKKKAKNRTTPQAAPAPTELLLDARADGIQITMTCVAVNATTLSGNKIDYATDENDYGLAWVLTYGEFRYFTGGDLGGIDSAACAYVPIETPVAEDLQKRDVSQGNFFNGHVCTCKLNHHASHYSTNARFLSILKPTTTVISCGEKHGHPHEAVSQDLELNWDLTDWRGPASVKNTISNYYCTSFRDDLKEPGQAKVGTSGYKGQIGGDVVIIVDDADIKKNRSAYAVYCNGEQPGDVVSPNYKMRQAGAAQAKHFTCH